MLQEFHGEVEFTFWYQLAEATNLCASSIGVRPFFWTFARNYPARQITELFLDAHKVGSPRLTSVPANPLADGGLGYAYAARELGLLAPDVLAIDGFLNHLFYPGTNGLPHNRRAI